MAYYFLKKYRCKEGDYFPAPLLGEWALSADSPSLAVEAAESHLKQIGLEADASFAVLFDYRGEIIWDRGP